MRNVFDVITPRVSILAVGGAIMVAGFAMGSSHKTAGASDATSQSSKAPIHLTVNAKPIDRAGIYTSSFAPVVKKVAPSVVKVFTSMKVKTSYGTPQMDMMPPEFRRFFGPGFEGRGTQREMPQQRQHGIGSGVIVTEDGYVLTNNHVVDGADEVKIAMQDGREFTGKVIGKDPKADVAVVKVSAKGLPFLEIADSDKIEVGDLVLAIGNPFGIGQTVTTGIISAKGRGNMGLDYEDFLQTDAAINPGNSGGALVDVDGRLVGINTAILSRSGGNQGIGFAIPSNLARYVMESLVKDGRVARGYMGVQIQNITPELAKQFDTKAKDGALVGDVVDRSPADKAGLKNGDIIVEFNGKPVNDSRQLKLLVAQTPPGTKTPLKILRDGSSKTLQVTLTELPGEEKLALNSSKDSKDNGTLNGVEISDINSQARHDLKLSENAKGAVVTEVAPDSAANEAGLQAGDVILEINRHPITNAEDAVRLTENPKDKTSLLRIWRNGGRHYIVVDESKAG